MIERERAVEPGLQAIAHGDETYGMPLAERRRFDARRGDLPAAAIVVVQAEVVFKRIGPDNIVLAVSEVDHDAPRFVNNAPDRRVIKTSIHGRKRAPPDEKN